MYQCSISVYLRYRQIFIAFLHELVVIFQLIYARENSFQTNKIQWGVKS